MFHGTRWAAAFVAVSGTEPGALACLKTMAPPIKAVYGAFGRAAARRLEKLLWESAEAAGFTGADVNCAIRFISLLVEKNLFAHIDSIMHKIEALLDQHNGVLAVTAESASPLDGAFEDELKRRLAQLSGAAQVKLDTHLAPELLGGYRLRFGGFYIDASLKGQIESMKDSLGSAAFVPVQGV